MKTLSDTRTWHRLALSITVLATIQNEVVSKPLEAQELEKFEQFKANVWNKINEEKLKTDFYLMKYLSFKEFNVDDATDLFLENMEWRKENNMSTILAEDFSDILEDYPFYSDTVDKVGRPIIVVNLGTWDIRQAVVTGKLERVNRVAALFMETANEATVKAHQTGNEQVEDALYLMDVDGMNNVQQLCAECLAWWFNLVSMIDDRFPGTFREIIIVNANSAFVRLFSAVKPLVSKDLSNRLIPFDNLKKGVEYLDERIDKDQRYVNFGGTKVYPE